MTERGHKSGEYNPVGLDHGQRISALEKQGDNHADKIDRHNQRLSLGDVGFAEVRKDIHVMTEAIKNLASRVEIAIFVNQVNWMQEAGKSVVFWLVPLIGGGLLWSIVHSGAVAK